MNDVINELLPRKVRLWLYLLAALVLIAFSVYQASEGDWATFTVGLAAALVDLLAAKNTPPPVNEDTPPVYESGFYDGV